MEDKFEAVKKMQDYIELNLKRPITLYDLSKVANFSTYYSERIFKELVGCTLFEYIRKCRLTAAAKELRDGNSKVFDTALDYMFDSHEGFTRSFSKQFGISPYKYKKKTPPMQYFIPYKVVASTFLKKEKKENTMETRTIFTQIIERPARKAIIKRAFTAEDYFAYCEEVGCDIWGILTSIKEALYEPAGFWLPKSMIKAGTSKYVQGVEVPKDYVGEVPAGFELIDLAPCSLMVFNSEPYDDENFMDEIKYVWDAIEKYNPQIYGYTWDETQPEFQLEPRGERGYIEAKPVKKIKL